MKWKRILSFALAAATSITMLSNSVAMTAFASLRSEESADVTFNIETGNSYTSAPATIMVDNGEVTLSTDDSLNYKATIQGNESDSLPANIVLPAGPDQINDSKLFVGWNDGEKTYAAGTEYDISGFTNSNGKTFTAVYESYAVKYSAGSNGSLKLAGITGGVLNADGTVTVGYNDLESDGDDKVINLPTGTSATTADNNYVFKEWQVNDAATTKANFGTSPSVGTTVNVMAAFKSIEETIVKIT